jgi:hypothetical protein
MPEHRGPALALFRRGALQLAVEGPLGWCHAAAIFIPKPGHGRITGWRHHVGT